LLADLLESYFKLVEIPKTNKAMKVVLDPKLEYTKLQIMKVVVVIRAKIHETVEGAATFITMSFTLQECAQTRKGASWSYKKTTRKGPNCHQRTLNIQN